MSNLTGRQAGKIIPQKKEGGKSLKKCHFRVKWKTLQSHAGVFSFFPKKNPKVDTKDGKTVCSWFLPIPTVLQFFCCFLFIHLWARPLWIFHDFRGLLYMQPCERDVATLRSRTRRHVAVSKDVEFWRLEGTYIICKSGPPTKITACIVSRGRLRRRNQTNGNLSLCFQFDCGPGASGRWGPQ